MYSVDLDTLDEMVLGALDALPAELRARIDNLDIGVEDVAAAGDYARSGTREGVLLGVYRGVPLTARTSGYNLTLPDRIVIFQHPLEQMARDEAHLRELVQHTVLHEIAHHFGISDARLRELGAY